MANARFCTAFLPEPGFFAASSTSVNQCTLTSAKRYLMKIYDRAGFPNPARIRIVLAEKGLDSKVQFIPVDLIAGWRKKVAELPSVRNRSGQTLLLEDRQRLGL